MPTPANPQAATPEELKIYNDILNGKYNDADSVKIGGVDRKLRKLPDGSYEIDYGGSFGNGERPAPDRERNFDSKTNKVSIRRTSENGIEMTNTLNEDEPQHQSHRTDIYRTFYNSAGQPVSGSHRVSGIERNAHFTIENIMTYYPNGHARNLNHIYTSEDGSVTENRREYDINGNVTYSFERERYQYGSNRYEETQSTLRVEAGVKTSRTRKAKSDVTQDGTVIEEVTVDVNGKRIAGGRISTRPDGSVLQERYNPETGEWVQESGKALKLSDVAENQKIQLPLGVADPNYDAASNGSSFRRPNEWQQVEKHPVKLGDMLYRIGDGDNLVANRPASLSAFFGDKVDAVGVVKGSLLGSGLPEIDAEQVAAIRTNFKFGLG